MKLSINMKSSLRRITRNHRGQLNIIEVVLAASILLLLSVSIAQTGVKIADKNKGASLQTYESLPQDYLSESDKLGYLRPFIYNNFKFSLSLFLNDSLPIGTFYWLYEIGGNCLSNNQIDCSSINTVQTQTYSGSLFLSGFITDNTSRVAYLTISIAL